MAHKAPERTAKTLRAALGLTQEQFAARLGVTVSTVNRWENGKGRPSPLAQRRIEELWQEVGSKKSKRNGLPSRDHASLDVQPYRVTPAASPGRTPRPTQ